MSYDQILFKKVKVKKEHLCEWCDEKIEKSQEAWRRIFKSDGNFSDTRMHLECCDAMERSDFYDDEGFYPGNQKRGKTLEESFDD